jgi:hypothetical membrane protein
MLTVTVRMKKLLSCGVIGGPLFITASLAQAALVDGFDLRRQQISSLSLGEYGWVQVTNFVLTGLLIIAFAVGLRRAMPTGRGRRLIPVLFGIYGVAMILGGVFFDDPAFGFPPGTPQGPPATMSWHGAVHALGAVNAFVALIVASLAFAWRFASEANRWWAVCSAVSGIVAGVLVFSGDPGKEGTGALLAAGCVVMAVWLTSIAVHFARNPTVPVTGEASKVAVHDVGS